MPPNSQIPQALNTRFGHHAFLQAADSQYIYTHALLSTQPHVGRLPGTLDISRGLVQSLEFQLDPPDTAWRDLTSHLNRHYRGNQARYTEAFSAVAENMKILLEVIGQAAALRAEDIKVRVEQVDEYLEILAEDPAVSYEAFPYFLLNYHNLLTLGLRVTASPTFQSELDRISFVLTYPTDSAYRSFYSLNVRYSRNVNVGGSFVRELHFLSGYRLGTSRLYGPSPQQAVFLRAPSISTLHSNFGNQPNSQPRPGLLCTLNLI